MGRNPKRFVGCPASLRSRSRSAPCCGCRPPRCAARGDRTRGWWRGVEIFGAGGGFTGSQRQHRWLAAQLFGEVEGPCSWWSEGSGSQAGVIVAVWSCWPMPIVAKPSSRSTRLVGLSGSARNVPMMPARGGPICSPRGSTPSSFFAGGWQAGLELPGGDHGGGPGSRAWWGWWPRANPGRSYHTWRPAVG